MKGVGHRPAAWAVLGLLVAGLAVVASSCSGGDEGTPSAEIDGLGTALDEIRQLAREEGEVNLVTWPGYADAAWADAFARQTGCTVNAQDATRSEDMIGLLRAGESDGISASGDASVRLMADGDVAPIDTDLIPNYDVVQEGVKNQSFNSLDGQPYGVPFGRTPNLLAFRTDAVPEATDSWDVIWEKADQHSGKVSIYDDPIVIADAAVYLLATQPDLGIEDPYQLNDEQFQAAVRLLRSQAPHVGEHWSRDVAQQVASFTSGDSVVGTTWPQQANLLESTNVPVTALKPREGTTGWSDTWMIYSQAANPNCMYLWMDYIVSADAQAKVAERFGQAPVNLAACELTTNASHCTDVHADDEAWWDDVYYWTTPTADCGDPGRGETCKTQEEWNTAWMEIR